MAISKLESLAKKLSADGDFSRADAREVAKLALTDNRVSEAERGQLEKIVSRYQDQFDVGGSRALREFMASPSNALPDPIEAMGKDPFTPDNLEQRFTEVVGHATKSIDGAFFQVLDPKIVDSLVDAAKRGVHVRMVTDDNYFDEQDSQAKVDQRVAVKGEANDLYIQLKKVDLTLPDAPAQLQALKTRLDAVNQQIPNVPWPSSQTPDMSAAQKYLDAALGGQPVPDKATLSKAQVEISHELSNDKVLQAYRPAYDKLIAAGVELHDDNSAALSHNKYMVLDDQVVWAGSYNLQGLLSKRPPTEGLPMTADNAVVMKSPELAKAFDADFAQMIAGKFHQNKTRSELDGKPAQVNGVTVTPYFSPDDSVPGHLADALDAFTDDYLARKARDPSIPAPTVRVAAFTFSYKSMERVVDSLAKLKAAGADVQVILDGMTAHASYSATKPLQDAGITVEVAHSSVMMHNKFLSIEDGDHGFVWTGSANFTGPAYQENDESVLKIDSPDIARDYERFFDELRDNLQIQSQLHGVSDESPDSVNWS